MKFAITAVYSYWVKLIPLSGKAGSKEVKLPRACFQLAIPEIGDVVTIDVAPVLTPQNTQAKFADVMSGRTDPR